MFLVRLLLSFDTRHERRVPHCKPGAISDLPAPALPASRARPISVNGVHIGAVRRHSSLSGREVAKKAAQCDERAGMPRSVSARTSAR